MSNALLSGKTANLVRVIAILAILGLAIYVALAPNVIYAPTPRVVLFTLVALLPAILLGAEAATRFEFKLLGLIFTTAGVFAAFLGLLFLLNYLSKPSEQIAVYQVIDEQNDPVRLDWDGAINVAPTERGLSVTRFIEGNTVILIFPEQVGQVEMSVKKSESSPTYSGLVNYAGTRTLKLKLGDQLKSNKE